MKIICIFFLCFFSARESLATKSICGVQPDPIKLWPGPYIYYEFDPNTTNEARHAILRAIDKVNNILINRQFREIKRAPEEEADSECNGPYLYINNKDENGEFFCTVPDLGWNGKSRQEVHMMKKCYSNEANVERTLLRVLGLPPENNRSIRDRYITIKRENIKAGKEWRTDIVLENNSTRDYPYCVHSIMHFSNEQFSNGNGPTLIWKKDHHKKFGQRKKMMPCDIARIRAMYHSS